MGTDAERSEREEHELPSHHDELPTRAAIVASLAVAAAILLLVALIGPLRAAVGDALQGDTDALRADLRGSGAAGVVLILALALAHTVIFYPAEILDAAVGYIYGFWAGTLLVMIGWIASGIISHQIGRHAGRGALLRILGRERFLGYERAVARGGVLLLLAMRLIPIVPFSLFSYVAGSARVPLWTFTWTTVIGYLPLTAVVVYVGSNLEELSPTDPALWIGAAAVIAMLLITKRWLPTLLGRDREG